MQRKRSSFITVCLLVVLGMRVPTAWAQQNEEAFRLDPLIITATRSAERLSQTTRSVTVIGAEDIATRGAQTVADALRSVAGLDVVRSGSLGATTSVFTRGSESDHTAVLIDGVKVNVLFDGKFDMADLSVDNIERIEVVRGPASTLYGSAAVGGVIHIITKRGSGPPSANLTASGGSFGTHAQRATASAGTAWGGLSVSASRVESDGHLAFNNQYANVNVALRADLSPDERTDLDLTLRYIDSEYHFPTDGAGRVVYHNKYQTTHETTLGLRGARALLPWWNSSLQFGFHQRKRHSYPESPDESLFVTSEKRLAIDWQSVLDLPLGNLTLGAAHEDDEDTENDFRRHNTAGYAQLRLKPLEPVVLVGGLRVDEHSKFGAELTYQVSAACFLAGGTKLRAALGTGFREPLWGEIFSTLWTVGNPDLDPERSLTWELGVEQQLWEERLRLEGVFFSSRFKDLIEYDSSPPEGQSNFFNIEAAKAHGLEFSATLTPLPAWTFGAVYTWLRSEVTNAGAGISGFFTEGEPLHRRPEHKVWLFGRYTRGRFDGRLDLHHTGTRADPDWSSWPAQRVDNPSYTRIDVALGYKLIENGRRTLEVFGRVENLFDEDYEEVYGFTAPGFAAFGGIRMTL
jgi:vitamin B12 transporter